MKVLDRSEWEAERSQLMAETIKSFVREVAQPDDRDMVRLLREFGASQIADSLEAAIRELNNIAHQSYHIIEDMEDAGEKQAIRRNNYLAWQAGYARLRLDEHRQKARELIDVETKKQENEARRREQEERAQAEIRAICQLTEAITDEVLRFLRENPRTIDRITPGAFEKLIMGLVERMGFHVIGTGRTNESDGGIDFIATPKVRTPMSVVVGGQVKHHRTGIRSGVSDVDRLLAWKGYPFHIGLLVTNTEFTQDALFKANLEANKTFLRLRDRADVYKWLHDNFGSADELRELPDKIALTPRLEIRLPKESTLSSIDLWPLSKGPKRNE
jgi:hypothetical protein